MKKMAKKKKKKKAFWEDHVGGLTNKKKEPKKVEKVKPKKPKSKKFVTKSKKKVEVQKKTDRSVVEAKTEKAIKKSVERYDKEFVKGQIKGLMTNPHFGEWLQGYCYKWAERKGTGRGQIPTELPEFNVLQRSQSSVELKRDAKGKVVFTIKAYADTTFGAAKEAIETFLKVVDSVGNDEEE
jgi:hypothetical protein